MTQNIKSNENLQSLLKLSYEHNKSLKIPSNLYKNLDLNCLYISQLEIQEEDIALLIEFIKKVYVFKTITKLVVNVGEVAVSNKLKSNSAGTKKLHQMFFAKLLPAILEFISHSSKLACIEIDSILLNNNSVKSFTKSIMQSKELKWLNLTSCSLGDSGLKILTPALCKLHLHVIILDMQELTDKSSDYLLSILKAQESKMDNCFWNSTLRNFGDDPYQYDLEDNKFVSDGLVALSLKGNLFTNSTVSALCRNFKTNKWLLGFNIMDCKIQAQGIQQLITTVESNDAMEALLISGNIGCNKEDIERIDNIISNRLTDSLKKFSFLKENVSKLLNNWRYNQFQGSISLTESRESDQNVNLSTLSSSNDFAIKSSKLKDTLSNYDMLFTKANKNNDLYRPNDHYNASSSSTRANSQLRSRSAGSNNRMKSNNDVNHLDLLLNGDHEEDHFSMGRCSIDSFDNAIPNPSPTFFDGSGSDSRMSDNNLEGDDKFSRPPSRQALRPRSYSGNDVSTDRSKSSSNHRENRVITSSSTFTQKPTKKINHNTSKTTNLSSNKTNGTKSIGKISNKERISKITRKGPNGGTNVCSSNNNNSSEKKRHADVMLQVADSVLAMTKNLEIVSKQLRNVTESLSQSMSLNNSIQQQNLNFLKTDINSERTNTSMHNDNLFSESMIIMQERQNGNISADSDGHVIDMIDLSNLIRERMKVKLQTILINE